MAFPQQEFWSGLLFPSPGDLPDPGIEPVSPALASGFFTLEPPGKPSLTWGMDTEWGIISISKLSISILYYGNIAADYFVVAPGQNFENE